MAESVDIKEGFICPICHKDMRSPNNLLAHFQDQHSEEQDILSSLKELVGKAKKKILKVDDQDLEQFKKEIARKKYFLEESLPQDPGQVKSHTNFFKTVRRERLDHRTTETNKLIIRLDRLIRIHSADRKLQEQQIVTWLDGTSVTRCPSCASSFNLTKRQHHCRLCGSIMCKNCSYFLSYEFARKIIAPINLDTNGESAEGRDEEKNSDSDNIRACQHCMGMLECRRFVQMNQITQAKICTLYEYLQKVKSEIQPLLDMYYKMYTLLTSGDTTYQLQDAQSLRTSIAKHAETLDIVSKKIAAIPPDPNAPRAVTLQNTIRRATSNYIKEYLLNLPPLPTLQELQDIKNQRMMQQQNSDLTNNFGSYNTPKHNIKKIAVTTGWSPANVAASASAGGGAGGSETSTEEQHPLLEQIQIVKNYIQQAVEANRFDEVVALRENLKLLQLTYRKEVQSMQKLEQQQQEQH